MKTKLLFLALLTSTILRAESVPSQSPSPSSSPLASSILPPDHPAVKAWRDRRFGMFIHWGPVSLKGTEIGWSRAGERRDRKETIKKGIPAAEYDELYKKFNPVKFNADEWVATAKAAGMKYIVLVTKHHDGFCMFDSGLTDYKITSTPFPRDVTAELAEACRKQGLAFGVYYSPPDWHHPDFCTADHVRYVAYMHGQVKELLTKYGPLSTVWFDCTGGVNDPSTWNNPELFRMIRELQPTALVTTRCGGTSHEGVWGDYVTPEQRVGEFNITKPWETCMTICRQWAWNPNDKMKSLDECLRALIVSAGGDGNLLFNVGPTPEGLIEPRQVERLKEMGAWLAKYGESIYGTRGGPYKQAKDTVSTRKGNSVYLHILKWPEGEEAVVLPPLPAKITASKLLTGGSVTLDQSDSGLRITVPPADRNPIDTIVKLDLDRNAMEIEPITTVTSNPPSGAKATSF
jgi:alpha-L-fucosidase